jgi:hypothetical protein
MDINSKIPMGSYINKTLEILLYCYLIEKCFLSAIFYSKILSEERYMYCNILPYMLAVLAVNEELMENSFKTLITTYIDNKVGISENFFK